MQAQPPPDAYWVSRMSAETVMRCTVMRRHLAAGAGTWWHSGESRARRARQAEVSGDERRTAAAGGDRGIDPGPDASAISCGKPRSGSGITRPCPGGPDSPPGDTDGWQTLTWAQARQQALELAAGFIALGLAPGERVALMLPNRTEHVLADHGAVHAGGVPVTFYATLAAEQVGFVAGDCAARIAVLDGADQLARWQPVLSAAARPAQDHRPGRRRLPGRRAVPDLGRLRGAGPGAAGRRAGAGDRAAGRDHPGGPGHPAVHLGDHRQPQGRADHPPQRAVRGGGGDRWAATSTRTCAGCPTCRWPTSPSGCSPSTCRLSTAGHVHFCPDVQQLVENGRGGQADRVLRRAPGVGEDPGRHPGPAGRRGRPGPAGRGRAGHGHRPPVRGELPVRPDHPGRAGRGVPPADEQVLGPIRALLGLGEASVVSSAAAPLPPDVAAFFAGLGMKILDVYGMTETTGAFTLNTDDRVQARHRGAAGAGHGDHDRRGRRDPHPRPAEHARAT